VGPTSERPMVSPDTPKIDGSGTYTMPGLIDCHTHITFDAAPIALENETLTDTDLDLRCKANLEKQIAAGVTTIRDCGSWRRRATLYADNRDNIWPRVLSAGLAITPPGGHGHFVGSIVTTESDARHAIAREIDLGATFIKLIATGGIMTEGVGTEDIGLSEDAMKAAVETAHSRGARVTAHATGLAGARSAVRAGVDSLEHGFLLDLELVQEMAHRGTILVPTLSAMSGLLQKSADLPTWAVDKVKKAKRGADRSLAIALEHNVRIAAGTDSGTPLNPHGGLPNEIRLLVEAGLPLSQALCAATSTAAENLGLADSVGMVRVGLDADLLLLDHNPLKSTDALTRINAVVQAGRVRRPGQVIEA
jgi:imidazolonepropionase-like amidohydrolase